MAEDWTKYQVQPDEVNKWSTYQVDDSGNKINIGETTANKSNTKITNTGPRGRESDKFYATPKSDEESYKPDESFLSRAWNAIKEKITKPLLPERDPDIVGSNSTYYPFSAKTPILGNIGIPSLGNLYDTLQEQSSPLNIAATALPFMEGMAGRLGKVARRASGNAGEATPSMRPSILMKEDINPNLSNRVIEPPTDIARDFAPVGEEGNLLSNKSNNINTINTDDKLFDLASKKQNMGIKPTAEFLGFQDNGKGEQIPLYNVKGGPLNNSTVSDVKLKELGIEVPPVDESRRGMTGDQIRQAFIESRNKAKLNVGDLPENKAPLQEGMTLNFNNARQSANNKKLAGNEPIVINDPKELNTDQVKKVWMKQNPSATSHPNILMNEPNVDKVREAQSYGYKPAGYLENGSLKLERRGQYPKTVNPVTKESLAQSIYDLPRGLMSVDPPFITSAAFRQAGPLIGTKEWFKAWVPAAKAFGSKTASESIADAINNHPLVKDTLDKEGNIQPGWAKKMKLALTDLDSGLNNREESLRGNLAEKIPIYGKYVRASNRAYTAYLNSIRLGTLNDLVEGAIAEGNNPLNNDVLGKQMVDFVNNATGRGSLGLLEGHTRLLSNTLFSPRGIAARVQMFNPMNYIATEPMIRKQYMKAAARQATAWWAMASLASLNDNVEVSRDPNSADFGKIKIGNTRIDPPGGLQQFLVLGNRMLPENLGGGGITSSTSGKFTPFGQGYKPETRMSTLKQFGVNRLHPTAKLAYDFLDAQPNKPFHMGDEIVKSILPMYSEAILEVAKENPGLLPIVIPLEGAGMGTQTYEKGSFGKSTFIPEEWDINIGAK